MTSDIESMPEIEVTEAMLEAGHALLAGAEFRSDMDSLLRDIFREMLRVYFLDHDVVFMARPKSSGERDNGSRA